MASNFNGSDGYFRIPDADTGGKLDFGTGSMTIAAWVKPDNYTNVEANIARKDPGGSTRGLYLLRVAQTTGVLQFQIGTTASFPTFFTIIAGATAVSTSAFSHVAAVRNSGATSYVYLNGVQDGSALDLSGDSNNTGSFAIGAYYDDGAGGLNGQAPYDGTIAEVSIWNRGLLSTEISFLASLPIGYSSLFVPSGLVAYYRLTLADTLEIDQINKLNVTRNGGVTAITGPPIIYPNRLNLLGVGG